MGATCAKYDKQPTTGRNTGRFGRHHGGQTGQTGTTGTKHRFQWPQRKTGTKTGTRKTGGIHLPTQGGDFGQRTRNTGTQTNNRYGGYGKQTRGQGQNGIFGNRLGQEGNNRQPRESTHNQYELPTRAHQTREQP